MEILVKATFRLLARPILFISNVLNFINIISSYKRCYIKRNSWSHPFCSSQITDLQYGVG